MEKNNATFFSIIIPTYQRAHLLSGVIRSVLSQSFSKFELLIIDDGSKDNTESIIKALDDPRIQYHYKNNGGVSSARNYGAGLAKGRYLIFLDSDDLLHEGALLNYYSHGKINSELILFSGYKRRSTEKIRSILPSNISEISSIPGTFALPKQHFISSGGYDEKIKYSENTELLFRIRKLNFHHKIVKFYSIIYNESPNGESKNIFNKIESLSYILEKHDSTLTEKVKFLYHQIIGVNYLKISNYDLAFIHFQQCVKYQPFNIKGYARLMQTFYLSIF
ncbi:glycosyl transferase [Echinicola pacifica]|uniref:Glycosyl transferase n=1 Tax=Echinicola pacifica TaxID=346377 RepID=A0A918PKH9_9BACT|nr:glycosyltransferase family A protein [Echinicola pacifica]GGZ12819.1 glycosyl transferase [Echinicola pacifica]